MAQVTVFAVKLLFLVKLAWCLKARKLPQRCRASGVSTTTSSGSLTTFATKLESALICLQGGVGEQHLPHGSSFCRTGAAPAAREKTQPHGSSISRTGAASAAREKTQPHGSSTSRTGLQFRIQKTAFSPGRISLRLNIYATSVCLSQDKHELRCNYTRTSC